MTSPNDGWPAFPTQQGHCPNGTWNQTYNPGMSLRDWFAGMALQGWIAKYGAGGTTVDETNTTYKEAAYVCYKHADAMLLQRSQAATLLG